MKYLGDGGLDLPYEGQERTDLTDDFVLVGGVVVMAAVMPVDGENYPALAFRFALPHGEFMPPVLLVGTDEQMEALVPLITAAVDGAVKAIRA